MSRQLNRIAASVVTAVAVCGASLTPAIAASPEKSVSVPYIGQVQCSDMQRKIGGKKVSPGQVEHLVSAFLRKKYGFAGGMLVTKVYPIALTALSTCDLLERPTATPSVSRTPDRTAPTPVGTNSLRPAPGVQTAPQGQGDVSEGDSPHEDATPVTAPTTPAPTVSTPPAQDKPVTATQTPGTDTPVFGLTCKKIHHMIGNTALTEAQIMGIVKQQASNRHVPALAVEAMKPTIVDKFASCGLVTNTATDTTAHGDTALSSSLSSTLFAGSS